MAIENSSARLHTYMYSRCWLTGRDCIHTYVILVECIIDLQGGTQIMWRILHIMILCT